MDLLRSRGHEVALFSMADPRGEPTSYDDHFVPHLDFKTPSGTWSKVQHAAHAIYSTDARRRLRSMLRDFRPDVAHVRNIYHHLSPSILWELKVQRVPVLYHINDFKSCARATTWSRRVKLARRARAARFEEFTADAMLSGVWRSGDFGGRSVCAPLVRNLSEMCRSVPGSKSVCADQVCRAWMGRRQIRRDASLSGCAERIGARRVQGRSNSVCWKAFVGEGVGDLIRPWSRHRTCT